MNTNTEIKRVGRSGQISLGKRYAGKTLRLERFSSKAESGRNLVAVLRAKPRFLAAVSEAADVVSWPQQFSAYGARLKPMKRQRRN
jgi:hypothetical protein